MLKIGRAFSHQDIQDLAARMGVLPLEKEKNLGILSIVTACGVAADAHVPGSAGEGSVSRMRATLLAEC